MSLPDNLSQKDKDTINRIRASSMQIIQKFNSREDGFDQKYRVGKRLGEGMHSVVFECFSLSDGLPLAVKVTREEDEEKKLSHKKEYLVLKDLDHPNIVNIADFFQNEFTGESHLVMKRFEGEELFEVLATGRVFGPMEIQVILF